MIINNEENNDSLLKGAFALTLSVLIVKIIGFIYKVPLSYVLCDEGMGYFNSAYTIFTFFYTLCSGGVPKAVSILITEMRIKGNFEGVKRVLSLSLRIFVGIGFSFSALLFLFSGALSKMIGNSMAAFSLLAIAPSLTFVSASGVLRGYLNGREKVVPIAVSEVIEGCIKFIFGLSLALFGKRCGYDYKIISALAIFGVTFGSFVGTLFLYICSKIYKISENTWQKNECDISNRAIIKGILRISVPITLSAAIMGISNIIDLGMIMKRLAASGMSSEEAIALYGNFTTLAMPMINLIMALFTPICSASLPHLTASRATENKESFKSLCERILLSSSVFSAPMFFAYLLFSKEILCVLFKNESALLAAPLLSCLAPVVIFMPTLTLLNTVLESVSRPKLSLLSMSLGAVLKLTVGYILIGRYGIVGAPISTCLSYALSLILSAFFVASVIGVEISFIKTVLPPLALSAASIGACRALYLHLTDGVFNLPIFIFSAALAAVAYALLLVIFMRGVALELLKSVKINKKQEKTL